MKRLLFVMAAGAATAAGAQDFAPGESPEDLVARGEYLATVMDCAGCHMPRGSDGVPLFEAGLSGGNVGFEIPGLGIFWAPNLTPSNTGLGGWSDDEIATAITGGLRPDGRGLAPVMPWPAYTALSEADVTALVAYLRSLPATDAPRLEPVPDASQAAAPFFRVVVPQD
jgi:mono/diheme cytochrome c family protein